MTSSDWWETTPEESRLLVAFVKIDRKDSTLEWSELPEDEVLRRRTQYNAGVEFVAREMGAAQPLSWQGDGVMLFIAGTDEPAAVRGYKAAKALWERVRIDLNLPVRIAVHAGEVAWRHDTGKIASPEIDRCGHLEHAAPENAIAVSEDVYLALPPEEQRTLGPLGVTRRDGTAAYVFPAAAAERRSNEHFEDADDLALWDAFRRYAHGPDVRWLRYVGLRLHKTPPPSLDVREVFVPPTVDVHRSPAVRSRAQLGRARISATVDACRSPAIPAGAPVVAREAAPSEPTRDFPPWSELSAETVEAGQTLAHVLREHRSLVVLGDPGSGKTTVLRWLAVLAASGRLALQASFGIAERLLPLPVSVGRLAELRREGNYPSMDQALARYFYARHVSPNEKSLRDFLRARLADGSCLLLLDGLDEVRRDERDAVHRWIETFVDQHRENRFVVSSRRVGYAGFSPADAEVGLRPFDNEQVERFVRSFTRSYVQWELGHPNDAQADEHARDLLKQLQRSPRLRALARNPFLLSVLALIHRSEGRLPRHRVEAYQIFARALCETWRAARRLVVGETSRPDIPYEEEALPLLGELALKMQESFPTGVAPQEFVLDTLAGALERKQGVTREEARRSAAEFLRCASEDVQILLERGEGAWGFLHLTFQEFFAAAGLHAEERFEEVAIERLLDPRWEEVIRLGVGYLALVQKRPEAARKIVERVLTHRENGERAWVTEILKKQVPLAASLAGEAGDVLPASTQDRVARALVTWALDDVGMARSVWLVQLSPPEWKDRIVQLLLERLDHGWIVALELGHLEAWQAIPELVTRLSSERPQVRATVVMALGLFDTLEPLQALLCDPDPSVRASVVDALGGLLSGNLGHPADPGQLRALMLEEKDVLVRAALAEALALTDPELVLVELRARFASDDPFPGGLFVEPAKHLSRRLPLAELARHSHPQTRSFALGELRRTQPEASVPVLFDHLADPDPLVRATSLRELGALVKTRAPEAYERLLVDPDPYVRLEATLAPGSLIVVQAEAVLEGMKSEDERTRHLATENADIAWLAPDGLKRVVDALTRNFAAFPKDRPLVIRALWTLSERVSPPPTT